MMMQGGLTFLLNDLSVEDLTRTQDVSTYRAIKQIILFEIVKTKTCDIWLLE